MLPGKISFVKYTGTVNLVQVQNNLLSATSCKLHMDNNTMIAYEEEIPVLLYTRNVIKWTNNPEMASRSFIARFLKGMETIQQYDINFAQTFKIC